MMVKTHLSLSVTICHYLSVSYDPKLKCLANGWKLPVRDILEYGGAKFFCPMAGTFSMMPGTGSNPVYRRVDVDTETGNVLGLF